MGRGARRRLCELLAAGADRDQEPRHPRRADSGLRRAEGLPDAIAQAWLAAITQTFVVHLLRNSFRYASKRDWAAFTKDLKPVYTAASEAEVLDRFADFSGKRQTRYPAIIKLWDNIWAEFVPFLAFDREIRSIICTTNAIESLTLGSAARSKPVATSSPSRPPSSASTSSSSAWTHWAGRAAVVQPVEGRAERL